MFPLFKARGVDAAALQMYSALATSPWAMKPLIGACSDIFPIGGLHKKYWLLIGCSFGTFGIFMLILDVADVPVTAMLFFMLHLEMSMLDLLSEGKYAEIMKLNPQNGSGIIVFVNACQSFG